jgi:signal peptidase II
MRRDADLTVDPASAADEPSPRRPVAVGLGVAAVFVVLDQVTKALAENVLEPGRFVPWLGPNVGWQLVYNPGGAFGLPAPSWIFLVVTVLVVVIVARTLPRTSSSWQAAAYGLLLSGAIGNVIDRLVRDGGPDAPSFGGGEVVDFVAWGSFPRFNVADSAITVGFALLVLTLWLEERRAAQAVPEQTPLDEPGRDADPGPDRSDG